MTTRETTSNDEDEEGNAMSGYSGGTGMNAREFYEEFKAMLDFVGVGFSGMQDAIVTIRDGKIFVTAGNRSARLDVPEEPE